MSEITKPDAEEFSQTLEQIGEGWFRQLALGIKLGAPEALGITRREWSDRIGLKVRGRADRINIETELAAEGLSNRAIADVLGVNHQTVNNDLCGENSPPVVADQADGTDESGENSPPVEQEEPPPPTDAEELEETPSTRALLSQSDQNDWRTPRKYLDAAREVMGAIDLDPASSAEANGTVKAAVFYTEDQDGLKLPWKGTVWLNPPYGGNARLFVERLLKEYQVGNVSAACALLNSHPTETKWFQQLFDYSICFVQGRIDFGGPSRAVSSTSTHGSAIAYLGKDIVRFADKFSKFGAVVTKLGEARR
jgi:phage N-6-adenine-methyltransferase